ncbi:rhodanese-like domain-containing protein [bacterium]|nr:rhodanese-like domain-containing protein [bacterium]
MSAEHVVIGIAFFIFLLWKFIQKRKIRAQLPALVEQGAIIVDVRTKQEYLSGSNPMSINIPLDSIEQESNRLDPKKPIIVCCASGVRSSMAAQTLKKKGFQVVVNAGGWRNTI